MNHANAHSLACFPYCFYCFLLSSTSNQENIDYLIGTCEDILKAERQAWYSTAVSVRARSQDTQDSGVGDEESGGGDEGGGDYNTTNKFRAK